MLRVRLHTNLAAFKRDLSEAHRRQVPFAMATALNDIGSGVRTDIQASMSATFDRPTPFTLNATYLKKASKSDPTAWVGIREFAPKGTPAWKYLGPQVDGGPRRQKAFERRLQATNQAAAFAAPGPGAQLDSYGNMSRGQLVKILSGVGAFTDTGQNASESSARRKKGQLHPRGRHSSFFIGRGRGGKPTAVYQLKGRGHVVQVLRLLDKAPEYSARWDVRSVVLSSIGKRREGAFARAWSQAIATAR